MSLSLVSDWMNVFGINNFQGRTSFRFQDSFDFTIELSGDEKFLCLSADILELKDDPDKNILITLLKLNHMGSDTEGAVLSLDETAKHVVCWYSRPVEGLDPEAFENLVGTFLDTALNTHEQLRGNNTSTAGVKKQTNAPSPRAPISTIKRPAGLRV